MEKCDTIHHWIPNDQQNGDSIQAFTIPVLSTSLFLSTFPPQYFKSRHLRPTTQPPSYFSSNFLCCYYASSSTPRRLLSHKMALSPTVSIKTTEISGRHHTFLCAVPRPPQDVERRRRVRARAHKQPAQDGAVTSIDFLDSSIVHQAPKSAGQRHPLRPLADASEGLTSARTRSAPINASDHERPQEASQLERGHS